VDEEEEGGQTKRKGEGGELRQFKGERDQSICLSIYPFITF